MIQVKLKKQALCLLCTEIPWIWNLDTEFRHVDLSAIIFWGSLVLVVQLLNYIIA